MKMAGTKLILNTETRAKITSPNPLSWKQMLLKAHSLCEGNEAMCAAHNLATRLEYCL